MNIFSKDNSQRGFTLIEMMIVAVMIAIMSLAFATVSKNMFETVRLAEDRVDAVNSGSRLLSAFLNSDVCMKNKALIGTLPTAVDATNDMNSLIDGTRSDGTDRVFATKGSTFPGRNFKVESIKFQLLSPITQIPGAQPADIIQKQSTAKFIVTFIKADSGIPLVPPPVSVNVTLGIKADNSLASCQSQSQVTLTNNTTDPATTCTSVGGEWKNNTCNLSQSVCTNIPGATWNVGTSTCTMPASAPTGDKEQACKDLNGEWKNNTCIIMNATICQDVFAGTYEKGKCLPNYQ